MSCASGQTTKVARDAHEIVIPTGQTLDDLRPAVALAHDLVDAGIEPRVISFAVMTTTRSTAELTAARGYLSEGRIRGPGRARSRRPPLTARPTTAAGR